MSNTPVITETDQARLALGEALEQTPSEAAQARFHIRHAIQHLDAVEVDDGE